MGAKTATVTASDIPSDRDAMLAGEAGPEVAMWDDGTDSVPACFGAAATDIVDILTLVARLLKEIPDQQIVHGNGFALIPLRAELTTRQATVPLQVSGMHLVHSLDGGRVPCRKVNAHCHVRAQDILAYYREIDLVVACARD